jgi:hypothetical protein
LDLLTEAFLAYCSLFTQQMDVADPADELEHGKYGFRVFGDSDDESSLAGPDGEASAAAEPLEPTEAHADVQSFKKSGRKRPRDGDTIRSNSKYYKQHMQIQLSDVELAAEVAEAAGLHPHRLGDHEQGVLNEDNINDDMYFKVCQATCAPPMFFSWFGI